ncbi:hypothetical protein PHMEG_0007495 [Phytophthora megakarya]|uniref:Uncharacterized protein n=1 Tax=Phytophthora megakarya TaxID=4795 RepID=A0A225WL43_9STRA|nr:hypothetical protein PHMEG_0007495 [Phytophthora megakarya]
MKQDLLWWWQVLHQPQLNGVSLEYFNALPPPDIIIEVDASDFGLCALDITAEHALTYRYTPTEINLITDFKAALASTTASCSLALLPFMRGAHDGYPTVMIIDALVTRIFVSIICLLWLGTTSYRRANREHKCLSDFSAGGKQRIIFGFLHLMWLEWTTFALTPAPAYPLTSLTRLCFHH